MVYLIIPVVCFVLIAGLIWALVLIPDSERTWKGRITGLDVILSVLMTAKGYEPSLLMKVPRRVTWLKATFPDSAIRLEMPLITRLQMSRKDRYLALLRGLGLDPRVSRDEGDNEILEFQIDGPPARASAIIKEAFERLFEVDPTRTLEFRATANLSDWNVVEQALYRRRPGDKVDLPVAATQARMDDAGKTTAAGCFGGLAGLFLLPIPFVVAYLQFGYVAASAVLLAIIVTRYVYWRLRRPKRGLKFRDFMKIVILGLAGATIYLGDPLPLQLIPSVVLSIVAVAEVLRVSLDLPSWLEWPGKALPRTGQLLLSFGVVATCLGGVALNEYLRANVSLDAWVWYFAFFRIELVFGFLAALVPFFTYSVRRLMREEKRRELWSENEPQSEHE